MKKDEKLSNILGSSQDENMRHKRWKLWPWAIFTEIQALL